jgi:3-deoxy-D-manno-octulosonate 8-phosphate phosphatase (KDO 8-P phosphatase)
MSATDIRLLVTDVDGVWTDGTITYFGGAAEIKAFNVRDGLGVKLAQQAGIAVAVVTSRQSPALERRCRELGIADVVQGAADKLVETAKLAKSHNLTLENVCYIGDDLPDLASIAAAAIGVAPADAAPEVRAAADWVLDSRGGAGAIRELVERLLRDRGEWERIVGDFRGNAQTPGSI